MAQEQLKRSRVLRGGVTAPRIHQETDQIDVSAAGTLDLRFEMASKGGGTTRVLVEIGVQDFGRMLAAMAKADRQAAMLAMSEELNRQIQAQPRRDKMNRRAAQKEVLDLAQRKLWFDSDKPYETRKIVHSGVASLLREVDAP